MNALYSAKVSRSISALRFPEVQFTKSKCVHSTFIGTPPGS